MIKGKIITPEGLYKEFESPYINITSKDGERGILEHHTPVCFMLGNGKLEIGLQGEKKIFSISGGLFYFEKGNADIITDHIEPKE